MDTPAPGRWNGRCGVLWTPLAGNPGSNRNRHLGSQFTERDALLMAYPDQVRAPGKAPLRTLAGFCQTPLRNLASGMRILPFYPWTRLERSARS